jgi:hypothetical protein
MADSEHEKDIGATNEGDRLDYDATVNLLKTFNQFRRANGREGRAGIHTTRCDRNLGR